ncbi:xanthine dehydrogenase family protein subunit M [uncultured Sphingomonas sp.]|uniref:FAD binding domain-containing protein n=1 Tax=uncultured Sphingomonas sp. TaxID=158754 RepID=UPI0025F9AD3B|nr:xanthine dehydrogenase family protein subunit M [uncultured Sphingomonas sp.]
MTPFTYARADAPGQALELAGGGARFLGGGTNLIDLMRERIEAPAALVDVSGIGREIEETADGGLRIGAGVRNTDLAGHPLVRARYPLVTRAIVAGASAQIRNMATVGGNLLQRTRCTYFYDVEGSRCNKRVPGEGCDAQGGFNRIHAILGASEACVATHPSDLCVALTALDATVHTEGPQGARQITFGDFHLLPGDTPDRETALVPGELVTAIELPPLPIAAHSRYRKVRDRASYAFALISVAAALRVEDGRVAEVRLALGGVAHRPWRAHAAEAALVGAAAGEDSFLAAADAELGPAVPLRDNAFKIELARRTIAAVLSDLSEAGA